jgi:hypothetical protein
MHIIASLGLLLIVLGLSGGAWYVWERVGDALIPAGRYLVCVGALATAFSIIAHWLTGKGLAKRTLFTEARIWVLGLAAIFFSDWMNRSWGLFKGPAIRGELLVMFGGVYLLLSRGVGLRWMLALPFMSGALLIWSFFLASDGKLLFSDDHAMFIFRLKLLKENFPSIPFWSPLWNAGFDARDFFATGALNAFFVSMPLIYAASVEAVYPYIIALLVWLLPIACTLGAARLVGFSWLSAAISSTLSVSSTVLWYRWGLKYGTVGFITSAALFPLVLALAFRFIQSLKPRYWECLALCITTTLMLLWSPSGIAALPIALCSAPLLPRLIRSRRHMFTLLLILALNLPWMTMMWKVSKVGKFLGAERPRTAISAPHDSAPTALKPEKLTQSDERSFRHEAGSASSKKALAQWHNFATSLNPLVLVCAIPALLALPSPLFYIFATTATWLTILGTLGVSLKPQLELDRMLVLCTSILAIPIGGYIAHMFERLPHGRVSRCITSSLAAFLLVGPCAAASVVLNRADDHYFFATDDVEALTRVLQDNVGAGRVVFSGCVLHELSGGHLGPLPIWANAPMVASSYAHNIWKYEQPIPQSALDRGDSGIQEFFNLMNATLVVAHEPTWIDYFRSRPALYSQLWRGDRFFVFKRLDYSPSYALQGELSQLSSTSHSITFTPKTSEITLKFKFFPFLTSSGCSLERASSDIGIDLIRLVGCTPNSSVTISSVPPLTRLLRSEL